MRLQFGKCQSQADLGNSRFKFPARWAGETPDDYSTSHIPFSGQKVCVHIHIHTYITSIWGKKKVKKITFWMKSASFTSKPQGLWRKECYNITDPSRQPFPPLAPTNSYPDVRVLPSHRREQSFLLSLCLCNGFPTLCLLFSVPLLWDLAKIIFWSSDIPVSWSLLTRLLFVPFNLPFLIQFLQPYRLYLFQS